MNTNRTLSKYDLESVAVEDEVGFESASALQFLLDLNEDGLLLLDL